MFKLIKILNSGVNVPEITTLAKSSSLKVKRGAALIISNGYAANCPAATVPTHIAVEDSKDNSGSVFCHEVNSNMLFETTVSALPTELLVGMKVTLAQDSDNNTTSVSALTESGVATIVDLMNATAAGDKVTVKF